MNREQLSKAVGEIDDRHITGAAHYAPGSVDSAPERTKIMKTKTHFHGRTLVILAAALALALAAAVTAYAAGWFSPIFHRMQSVFAVPEENEEISEAFATEFDHYKTEVEERNARYAAAERAVIDEKQEPETVVLPEFDNTSLTLSERYYDGETLLLGVNLNGVAPDPVVDYEPDAELRGQIQEHMAFFYSEDGDDTIDHWLELGVIDQEEYEEILASRSDYAKAYDLRHMTAIQLDSELSQTLDSETYAEFWRLLQENGHVCVVESSVYIGDHIVLDDGTDLGPTGQINLNEFDSANGDIFIEADRLPETAKNRDALNINVKLKAGRTYYLMELDSPVYAYYETADETLIPFTIENSKK